MGLAPGDFLLAEFCNRGIVVPAPDSRTSRSRHLLTGEIKAKGLVFVSGQLPLHPETDEMPMLSMARAGRKRRPLGIPPLRKKRSSAFEGELSQTCAEALSMHVIR